MVEFKPFDQQSTANATIGATPALVFPSRNFGGVRGREFLARLKMRFKDALEGADGLPEFTEDAV